MSSSRLPLPSRADLNEMAERYAKARTLRGGTPVHEWDEDPPDPWTPPAWHAHAACRGAGTEQAFGTNSQQLAFVERYCSVCPVVDECEASADRYGAWGGRTHDGRRKASSTRQRCQTCGRKSCGGIHFWNDCEECSAPFESPRSLQRFCSPACRVRNSNRRRDTTREGRAAS